MWFKVELGIGLVFCDFSRVRIFVFQAKYRKNSFRARPDGAFKKEKAKAVPPNNLLNLIYIRLMLLMVQTKRLSCTARFYHPLPLHCCFQFITGLPPRKQLIHIFSYIQDVCQRLCQEVSVN